MPKPSDTVDPLLAALKELTLWKHFVSVASPEQQTTVKKLLDHADALLSRVVETFPTYTLHDRTHAINVANLMGKLAEPWIEEMNALEAGLLLLSAFWHDVGMVFTEEERSTIAVAEEFQEFLRTHPEARLEVAEDGELSRAVTEWFCRWSHAERVFHHLNLVEDRLEWEGIPLRQQLGALCRSHNLEAAELRRDDLCPTDFLGEADVRFCAVILRMADILDFDRTRSPDAIYHFLGIGRRTDNREKASDVEWRKHLESKGFAFPRPAERRVPYSLTFVASPDDPAVEWDVRQFLEVIEGEFLACEQLIRTCSGRWRDVCLPIRMDRKIYSKNYKFGDYRFILEQEQVLGLLMGEDLYQNPYVFVRELLQNALDASRHREFHERAHGRANFRCEPIIISEWHDQEQYHWVRFDDFGMGMTEEIVRNFLLRVGRSYYTSAEFQAELLQYQAQKGFTPISRFGIGLLSCFIAGDRVEITTRHATHAKSQSDSIRLALSGLHGFFTLQTGTHIPALMRGPDGDEPGYRLKPGTSVAVRLDPRKERGHLNLGKMLERYLLYPPIPVQFNDAQIGGDQAMLKVPLLGHAIEEQLGEQQMRCFIDDLAADPTTRITIQVVPIDLSSYSPTDKLTGQLVELRMNVQWELMELERESGIIRKYALKISSTGLEVESTVEMGKAYKRSHMSPLERAHLVRAKTLMKEKGVSLGSSSSLAQIWERIPAGVRDMLIATSSVGNASTIRLAHNGITIEPLEDDLLYRNRFFHRNAEHWKTVGIVSLSDELRPQLSISRESVNRLPINVCFALELAYRNAASDFENFGELLHGGVVPPQETVLRDVLTEPFIVRNGPWSKQPIFHVFDGASIVTVSAIELRTLLEAGAKNIELEPKPISLYRWWSTYELVERVILQRDFVSVVGINPAARYQFEKLTHKIVDIRKTDLLPGELLFPPLSFISFEESQVLRHPEYSFINIKHVLAEWLLDTSPELASRFPGFLISLREQFAVPIDEDDIEAWLIRMNTILDRLRAIDHKLGPPRLLRLTKGDIAEPFRPGRRL